MALLESLIAIHKQLRSYHGNKINYQQIVHQRKKYMVTMHLLLMSWKQSKS